jgi:hypothetical protein
VNWRGLPTVPVETQAPLVGMHLRTPRAAAVAGIVFSILLITSLWLLRISVPTDVSDIGPWLQASTDREILALNLVPFAGVAFMWFLGVLRDRLGAKEDKFFATVFLGSGLMFLGMMFIAAAVGNGLIRAYAATPNSQFNDSTFIFARAFSYGIMHIYAFKMAAVFMITTSTLVIRTRVTAQWIAWLGYASAAFLLIGSGYLDWAVFVFPGWVLLISSHILLDNMRKQPPGRSGKRHSVHFAENG